MRTRISKIAGLCGLSLALSACGGGDRPEAETAASTPSANPTDWRAVATPADRDRLRRWREAWTTALPAARAAEPAKIAAEGALFDPDRALANPAPPAGRYRCRVFKLGSPRPGGLAYVAYPYFDCRVGDEGELLSLFKVSGSQRPVGLIFPDVPTRRVFLGTLVLGDEQRALDYGQDGDRDMAGVIERVGERRWRLVLPWPRFESQLDVVELVPAG
ncbi:DUF4893 domain-containing protein [Sphingomonas sp. Y38-1Y]|uniref:DUF4893 domain-containing protein n=1 Tax=Sphingomonas sp. Y38-1Y TaxID=3078265 RepID=UPI0028E6D9E3|nr:DUF4893 domain-containing protein [Sphingomonas sp. Y38-1Y]